MQRAACADSAGAAAPESLYELYYEVKQSMNDNLNLLDGCRCMESKRCYAEAWRRVLSELKTKLLHDAVTCFDRGKPR
jgi:hypothetical protein